jgi:hypothetical protein
MYATETTIFEPLFSSVCVHSFPDYLIRFIIVPLFFATMLAGLTKSTDKPFLLAMHSIVIPFTNQCTYFEISDVVEKSECFVFEHIDQLLKQRCLRFDHPLEFTIDWRGSQSWTSTRLRQHGHFHDMIALLKGRFLILRISSRLFSSQRSRRHFLHCG